MYFRAVQLFFLPSPGTLRRPLYKHRSNSRKGPTYSLTKEKATALEEETATNKTVRLSVHRTMDTNSATSSFFLS